MPEVFRSLVLHQAKFHRTLLERWGSSPEAPRTNADQVTLFIEALVHDGVWLSKFPLLASPCYGVLELDALNKGWMTGAVSLPDAAARVRDLRHKVDADLLRFVLSLKPEVLETRIEIFFNGRAMNKPLWQYLVVWFEHNAVLRGRLGGGPGMADTVFD